MLFPLYYLNSKYAVNGKVLMVLEDRMKLVQILLSDIDGLYSADPKKETSAEIIRSVEKITPELIKSASGAGTSFGTGGMATKLNAAKICVEAQIDTIITNGNNPSAVYEILQGKEIGTHFVANNGVLQNN